MVRETEWSLYETVVGELFSMWGQTQIDLFATVKNKKALLFCSWIPNPRALSVDALPIVYIYNVFPSNC